jgi:mannose-6-phosphate isomerase-like protein (cupin superfamily)
MSDHPGLTRLRASDGLEGDAVWFGANRVVIKATGADTDGNYGAWVTWAPPGSSPPLHRHRGVDEAFWIAKGSVRFVVGDRDFTLGEGGYVLLPREVPHTFVVEGTEDAVMFGMVSPGGSELYFSAAGRPAETEGLPPAGPPDVARLAAAGEAFGIEILGPPLQPAHLIRERAEGS